MHLHPPPSLPPIRAAALSRLIKHVEEWHTVPAQAGLICVWLRENELLSQHLHAHSAPLNPVKSSPHALNPRLDSWRLLMRQSQLSERQRAARGCEEQQSNSSSRMVNTRLMSKEPYLNLQHGPVDLRGRDVVLLPVLQSLIAGVSGLHTCTPATIYVFTCLVSSSRDLVLADFTS